MNTVTFQQLLECISSQYVGFPSSQLYSFTLLYRKQIFHIIAGVHKTSFSFVKSVICVKARDNSLYGSVILALFRIM